MKKNAKIYVAGHRGLVGGGIWRALERHGFTHLIGKSSHELDLTQQQAVDEFFAAEKPELIEKLLPEWQKGNTGLYGK